MKFATKLELHGKTATGYSIPPEVIEALGAGKRPPVSITINGYTYRSTVAVMGGEYMLPLSAENREPTGLKAGDEFEADIVLDTAPREVVVPDDLSAAMDKVEGVRHAFDRLSFSNRKERVVLVESAKTSETRLRRIEKVVAELTP